MLFKIALEYSAEVLFSIVMLKMDVMYLTEKLCVLALVMSYNTMSSMSMNQQFILNKVSLNRNTHKTNVLLVIPVMYCSTLKNVTLLTGAYLTPYVMSTKGNDSVLS